MSYTRVCEYATVAHKQLSHRRVQGSALIPPLRSAPRPHSRTRPIASYHSSRATQGSASVFLPAVRGRGTRTRIWTSMSAAPVEADSPELEPVRTKAEAQLSELSLPQRVRSWVDPSVEYSTEDADPRRAHFDAHGFLRVQHFCSQEECATMMDRMGQLIETWDPSEANWTFRTDDKYAEGQGKAKEGKSDYFLDSANRTHFFMEVAAAAEDGTLKPGIRKEESLNKVGHGMHVSESVFRAYCDSAKMGDLVRALGWQHPVVPQSMYIFKQARIGGEVTSHQDSTFLYTTPRHTCLGLWLALEDATLSNGCLWVRPGSHREGLRRAFVRNPQYFLADGERDTDQPQMIFRDEPGAASHPNPWEGRLPDAAWPPPHEGLFEAGFVPVECKAGDLLVFPGTLDHLSLPNYSDRHRHTFQLHLVEGPPSGVTWSPNNWLQYPDGASFHALPKAPPAEDASDCL